VTEIREVLRAWLSGAGLRRVAAQAGVDRKTARRYVEAAVEAGLARDGGLAQLSDELVGQVAQVVRPVRPGGHGQAWDRLEAHRAQIQDWVKAGLSVVKMGVLLERQGIVVPYRTLHRFCVERSRGNRNLGVCWKATSLAHSWRGKMAGHLVRVRDQSRRRPRRGGRPQDVQASLQTGGGRRRLDATRATDLLHEPDEPSRRQHRGNRPARATSSTSGRRMTKQSWRR
jgi:hypothetical protein